MVYRADPRMTHGQKQHSVLTVVLNFVLNRISVKICTKLSGVWKEYRRTALTIFEISEQRELRISRVDGHLFCLLSLKFHDPSDQKGVGVPLLATMLSNEHLLRTPALQLHSSQGLPVKGRDCETDLGDGADNRLPGGIKTGRRQMSDGICFVFVDDYFSSMTTIKVRSFSLKTPDIQRSSDCGVFFSGIGKEGLWNLLE